MASSSFHCFPPSGGYEPGLSRSLVAASRQLDGLAERVYRLRDISNVYVITHGDRALLIDTGTGAILDHLSALGVQGVDWILHTHHHRDQCAGDHRLREEGALVAAPRREVGLLAGAEDFWRTLEIYDMYDCSSIYNTPGRNIPVDRALEDYEVFEWQDIQLLVLPTPGHTRGSVTYLCRIDGMSYAFTGDLVYAPGRLLTLHDFEWWYGMSQGFKAAIQSLDELVRRSPDLLLPSHGEVMDDPCRALELLRTNVLTYVHHTDVGYQTVLGPDPSWPEPGLQQISDHLIAATGTCANFYVLLSDDGQSLFFDYGFPTEQHMFAGYRFVEHSIDELSTSFGVPPPSVVVPSHYHDDHVCGIPHLQREYGTEVWAFEHFADVLAHPSAYRIPCLWREPISVSKILRDGESFEWGGHKFTSRHNPGHTWYAAAHFGEVDGQHVAVTGDEVANAPNGTLWGGAPVFRNRVVGSDFSTSIKTILAEAPQLLLTGHKGPLKVNEADLRTYEVWAEGLERTWHELAADPDEIGFSIDPDYISVYPYESVASSEADAVSITVRVRNHHQLPAPLHLRLALPTSWTGSPKEHSALLEAGQLAEVPFSISIAKDSDPGRYVFFAEASLGEHALGEVAEGLIQVASD